MGKKLRCVAMDEVKRVMDQFSDQSWESNLSVAKLAEVWFQDRFLKYGEYCSSLQLAQETLEALCSKNEAVALEVATCEKSK